MTFKSVKAGTGKLITSIKKSSNNKTTSKLSKSKQEEDIQDPDFDEFDIPKSKPSKSGGKEEDEDYGLDEDLNDSDNFEDDLDSEDEEY